MKYQRWRLASGLRILADPSILVPVGGVWRSGLRFGIGETFLAIPEGGLN